MDSQVHYLPLTPGFFSILVFLAVGLIILIQLRILRYAYMRLGVGPGAALALLLGSLIGSYFNIPITVLPGPPVQSGEIVEFFGMRYVVPVVESWPGTVLAVDVDAGAGNRHRRAGIRAGRGHRDPSLYPVPRICGAACLYRRLDGNAYWRRPSQPRQDRRYWRAGRLD